MKEITGPLEIHSDTAEKELGHEGLVFEDEAFDKDYLMRKDTMAPVENIFSSSMTVLNYTLGVTIMLLPKAMLTAGLAAGTLLLVFFALLNYCTCLILVKASKEMKLKSYYDIGKYILPTKLKLLFASQYIAVLLGNIIIY